MPRLNYYKIIMPAFVIKWLFEIFPNLQKDRATINTAKFEVVLGSLRFNSGKV